MNEISSLILYIPYGILHSHEYTLLVMVYILKMAFGGLLVSVKVSKYFPPNVIIRHKMAHEMKRPKSLNNRD